MVYQMLFTLLEKKNKITIIWNFVESSPKYPLYTPTMTLDKKDLRNSVSSWKASLKKLLT